MFLRGTPLLPPRAGTTARIRLECSKPVPSAGWGRGACFHRPFDQLRQATQVVDHREIRRVEVVEPVAHSNETTTRGACRLEVPSPVADENDLPAIDALP